ncbi:MAG: extracellular solute-binding protein [Clostridiales bacterium]|nr:extracellular solute-binding protein [Clostridiales bacterium]
MRKFLSVMLFAMMMLGLAAPAMAGGVVELEYVIHKSESEAIEGMHKVIDAFNAENPGIHVTLTPPPDFATVIQTRAQTNEMPDLFSCVTNNMYEIMFRDGLIMDLTGQPFLANVADETLALSTYESRNWRMPYSLSYYGLYVRTDIFEQQGLAFPTTWDELMDVCAKLQAAGITPFALPDKTMVYQRMERVMGIISDNDEDFRKIASGELAAADSKVLTVYAASAVKIADNMTEESYGSEYTESYQQLLAGQAAMTINGQWSLLTLKNFDPNVQVALIPLPNPTGEVSRVPVSIDTSFCISSSTKHPEEALKFLEFLSRKETAQMYTDIEGSPNVIKGVQYNVPELEKVTEKMNAGEIFISLNSIWPSGLRKELGDAATNLVIDKDVDTFLSEAEYIIDEYYNK